MGNLLEQMSSGQLNDLQNVVRAKHQWETMLDTLPQLICLIDQNGKIVRSNKTIEKWGFCKVNSVAGKHIHQVLHPNCVSSHCKLRTQIGSINKIDFNQEKNFQDRSLRWNDEDLRTGRTITFNLAKSEPSSYEDGKEFGVFLVASEITNQIKSLHTHENYQKELKGELTELTSELKRTNQELELEIAESRKNLETLTESENKYTSMVESMLTGIFLIRGSEIIFCNSRFAEILGYSSSEVKGMSVQTLFNFQETGSNLAFDYDSVNIGEQNHTIISAKTKDGFTIWLQQQLVGLSLQEGRVVMGNVVDITRQKNAEDALRTSQQELQILSKKLLDKQEEVRKHIALELHDSLGQNISAIKLAIENVLDKYCGELPERLQSVLDNEVSNLHVAIEKIRNMSMNLRPSMLDDLGLNATISWFLREYQKSVPDIKLQTDISIKGIDLRSGLRIVVFRIIQESLNNVAKHSYARNVKIALYVEKKRQLVLRIIDDGIGFNDKKNHSMKSFGLSSMTERAKLSNGDFFIESNPKKGTRIEVIWQDFLEPQTING